MNEAIDLNTKHDIEKVVRRQYQYLVENKETQHIFAHLDLEQHLPRIFHFWCFILDVEAEKYAYKGSAFEPHTRLGLTAKHFEIWQQSLHQAIDIEYKGEKSELMKAKAKQLGLFFQYKLGILEAEIPIKKQTE